jgi:hypothetical protein
MNTEFSDTSPDLQRVLLLDSLATRYHLLPSEVLRRSDTLDILVIDTAMSWHRMQHEQAQAKAEGKAVQPNSIPVNKLKEMIDRVRKNDKHP